jgi:ankyrin repeat protein
VEEFLRCATGNAAARALRLLERYPALAHANLFTELVRGDAAAVHARLQADPEAARRAGGVQAWAPLSYVCHSCLHQGSGARKDDLLATARVLLEFGADPNTQYHWNWHPELPRTVLWSALCAVRHLPLAEALLQAGATPDDGVSLHICAGGGDVAALELLLRHGVKVNGIPGGVPPLRYILAWAANTPAGTAGVRWLLEHGADPNLAWSERGDAPLHIAAERWDVAMVEELARHGAHLHLPRRDGKTAYAVAALHGNREVREWLAAHGAGSELSPLERFVAACTSGNAAAAEAMLGLRPELKRDLVREHHLLLHAPAERGDAAVLAVMLSCGFDPNTGDVDGVTPLHRAAMVGKVEAVRVLLAHGAAVDALDGMFAAPPLVWAVEGWNPDAGRTEADHLGVARLLQAAGSPRSWTAPAKAPNPEGTQEKLAALCRAAGG